MSGGTQISCARRGNLGGCCDAERTASRCNAQHSYAKRVSAWDNTVMLITVPTGSAQHNYVQHVPLGTPRLQVPSRRRAARRPREMPCRPAAAPPGRYLAGPPRPPPHRPTPAAVRATERAPARLQEEYYSIYIFTTGMQGQSFSIGLLQL